MEFVTLSTLPGIIGRYLMMLKVTDILDIAIMVFVFYKALTLIQSTRAASLLKGVLVFLAALMLSMVLNMNSINFIMNQLVRWGVVALTLVRMWVPRMEPLPDTGLKGQFRFLRSLAPWLVLASVMLGNGGIFCWYSYVSPLMIHTSGFTEENLTLVIMLAGFGMFAGNILGGHLSDRFTPEKVVRFTLAAATLTLLGIFFGAHAHYLSVVLMTLCTGCLFCVSSPQQLLILENSRGGEMLGAALVQVAFNLGNALGAYCGGLPIARGLGYEYTALPGAGFTLLGLLTAVVYIRKYPRHAMR